MATESTGRRASPYWGRDRRQSLASPEGAPTRSLLVFGGLILVLFAAVNLAGGFATPREDSEPILLLLETAAAGLAFVVAVLCVVRWRLVGEAASLWAGVALLFFGVVTVGVTGLVPLLNGGVTPEALAWLRPASRLVVIGLFAAAAASPEVDGRLTFGRLLALGTLSTAALTLLFRLEPAAGRHLAGAADVHSVVLGSPWGSRLLSAAWCVLAVVLLVRGRRENRPLLSWLGLLLAGLGLAEVTRVLAGEDATMWSTGAHLLRLSAVGVAMAGAMLELQRAFSHQSRHLLETIVSAATAEARIRAGRQEVEERAHEARNALTAIEGATQTLERYRDRLDAQTRGELVSALSAEIARLQRLVSAERLQEDRAMFHVAETLAPAITGARTQGAGVLVDIDEGLSAFGRWADTAEVVQNLIENARRYAPGSTVTVLARQESDRVLVRVEDRGPGVSPDQRDAIFHRGVRGVQADSVPGTGLGLYVSARLMREQGGDLWLEDRPGGGAVFVASLPCKPESAGELPERASGAG